MKTVKRILIGIVALIVLALIIALFVKKEFSAEGEVVINKSKQEVFDYVKLLQNQNNFSVWAKIDPGMKKEFRGTDGTEGFVSAWESNHKDVGQGEQEIKKITGSDRIDYEIRFIKPFKSVAQSHMTLEAAGDNQTKVKWGFSGSMAYPFNLMRLFMDMEKTINNDLQTGLDNLKGIMESQPAPVAQAQTM